MTDPMTDADLDAIERDRLGKPRLGRSIARETDLDLLAIRRLLAEVHRLRAMEQRARALHHRDVAVVITGGCAAEDCNHEELGDCDTIEFAYCAGCAALAEQVDCYFSERDFRPVAWPCPTIVALDGGQ